MKIPVVACLLLSLTSCLSHDKQKGQFPGKRDYLLYEKDLIPEGTAFDPATGRIFISSTYKRKIIQIDSNGIVQDFIHEAQDDIKSVLGMEADIKRNCLWVVSSEAEEVLPLKKAGKRQWWSSVYQFNLTDGKLIKKYPLNKDSLFLNDLTVGPDGTIYVTECMNNVIYTISPGKDSLQLFLDLKPYHFINGICFTDKPGFLFTSSVEGIIAIDLTTKNYSLLPAALNHKARDIDGLAFNNNYFIAHQSSKVSRFYLSPARDSIISSDTLDTGREYDSSTTGEVGHGYYHFIVNSQIQSGVDYKKRRIRPVDSLKNIIIRKIKL